jgi:uncharacterized membrane protein YbhN (UPF0104 family)
VLYRPAPASEIPLPAFEWRVLARRAIVPTGLAAVVVAALLAAGGPLGAFADAFSRALAADPLWVLAAAVFELLSFVGYIALMWLVAGRADERIGARASAQITLAGAAATRLLPTAGAGGAALTLWLLSRLGLGGRRAARTLVAFLVLLYAVFLAAIVAAGSLLALGIAAGHGPAALSAIPAAAALAGIATALAIARRHRPALAAPARPGRPALARLRAGAHLLAGGVHDALGLVRAPDVRLLGALAWWAFDAAVLWAMLEAFGQPPGLAVVAIAYFVGQVGNVLPIPGAVSGGIFGVLTAFGVAPDLALTSVLAYRSIAIWLPGAVGLAALPGLRSTLARWKPAPQH